jgi:hypothetical protein
MNKNSITVHFFYVVLILVLIIIAIASVRYGENTNLVNYISFAGTISSILLAVTAIIYSYYSTNSFSQNVGTLDSSTKKISESSTKLFQIIEKLDLKIDNIPDHLKGVEEKATRTYDLVEKLSNDFNVSKHQNGETNIKESDLPPDLIKSFITDNSFIGQKIIYACCMSYNESRIFPLEILKSSYASETLFDYIHGFLIAASCLNLFDYNIDKEHNSISISKINKEILIQAEEIILKDAKKHDAKETVEAFQHLPQLNKIKAHFNL